MTPADIVAAADALALLLWQQDGADHPKPLTFDEEAASRRTAAMLREAAARIGARQ